ncbi:response regulator [Sphaerisporangium album]|uniref:Response regulator n=1 Tax=Sphaerisporangium album TaxID=509200 RepID=A0A367FJD0_9ACTN|nr:response regulator [Sphaerisporangium album]RCG29932.1 response regulator [Sphaerisporangium album]
MITQTARPYHVLLVEDDAGDALLIEEALTTGGTPRSVVQAPDGVAALEYLRGGTATRPDLIVLDLNMPRMDGTELLGILKSDPDLKTIPVVMLTTSSSPDDISSAYRRHANAYIVKPVELDAFTNAVRSIDAFYRGTAARVPPA